MNIDESSFPKQETLPLLKSAEFLLNECRMVLPGIQALFGFQLIAVFSSNFFQLLLPFEQKLHLFALVLTTISIAFVMTPAAFHRQLGSTRITEEFIRLASRLLLWGMWPLLSALCIDLYLIAQIIFKGAIALMITTIVASLFISLWFILPQIKK